MPEKILVVDDELSMRELLSITLRQAGYDVSLADGGGTAIDAIRQESFALVITDLRMRGSDGMDVLRAVRDLAPDTVVIVVTAYASTTTAVEAMKLGAYDYVTKPFKLDEIRVTIANALDRKRLAEENRALRRQLGKERPFDGFVGKSSRMQAVFDIIRKTADSGSNVMITGESGTGKELVARAIHRASSRHDQPFVSVNCGAIPETLLESELFGHVKGAFTGAVNASAGLFASADRGTLFLDEITEIPTSVQVKLLRAIQEREVRRVGDVRDVPVDVQLIAASNRDLQRAVTEGVLREDLFYRLNVIPIDLPPLRDRREDLPLLMAHFIAKIGDSLGKKVHGFTPQALALLERHRWPGNIRELENVIERAMVLGSGDVIDADALPDSVRQPTGPGTVEIDMPSEGLDLEDALSRIEQRYIQMALERTGGVQTRAAELLRVSFRQFRYKLRKHSLRSM